MAGLLVHPNVRGPEITAAEVRREGEAWRQTSWADLSRTVVDPGRYEVRAQATGAATDDAVEVPTCAGRTGVRVDGKAVATTSPGPMVAPLAPGPHEVVIAVTVGGYERRIACGGPLRVGPVENTVEGLGTFAFDSPYASRGGGQAVVYVPPGRDVRKLATLLVGLHPWNGGIWTYAAYEELLREASARGVLLLMPSGLGNSLYTADAEDEVLRAIDALGAITGHADSHARAWNVSLWGASMGGAGATTIGFHHPDRFATVTSLFGDSRYDLSTYVRAILRDEHAAHVLNALDVADNARNLPVWLIHGEQDRTSPIRQSEMLADALRQRGFTVRFDRAPGMGHAGALVARYLPELVAVAAGATTVTEPARVTYWSVRPSDLGAYGVRIERASATGDAFVDVERRADGYHVLRQVGVRAVSFDPVVPAPAQPTAP
ncbi:MAG TPA: prolyl oligopeptidase family serine peptidase [Polyangiaceae bacterium]|jgi:pimeloyl-ACP methyl ester carboxylesterase|nr:prolyl oligopeptidase family serine peptidase [Polyangiaceae bacterium]